MDFHGLSLMENVIATLQGKMWPPCLVEDVKFVPGCRHSGEGLRKMLMMLYQGLWDDCARPRYYNSKCWGTSSWWGNMGLVQQIGLNGDPQPDQDNEASPMGVESNFMSQYFLEDLRELQRQDVDLELVICWLAADVTPTEAELMLQSSSTKPMWLYREQLKLQQRVLFYKWDHGLWKNLLLVIPGSPKDKVIQLFHDTDNGEDKTEGILVWNVNWCASLCCNQQAVHSEQEISTDYACSITKLSSRESWWSGTFGHAGGISWESSGEQICIDDYWSVHSVAGNKSFTNTRCGVCCQGIFRILHCSFWSALVCAQGSGKELW